jgi:SAM-dependent methyltransferase
MERARMQEVLEKVVTKTKPYVPVSVKRPIRRAIPTRYHHHFDPDWHRHTIGSIPLWEELGRLQFDYLVDHGLRPEHYLLDVGCGPLRGGLKFIPYLEPGHYYGVDKRADVIEESLRTELPQSGLAPRRPTVLAMGDFGFERLNQNFDYAIAQSVFTHLSLNSIIRCLVNMDRVLVPGGQFFATFYLNERGKHNVEDIHQTGTVTTHFDSDYYHYDVPSFEWACSGTGLVPEYLGGWENPYNQKMMVFRKHA